MNRTFPAMSSRGDRSAADKDRLCAKSKDGERGQPCDSSFFDGARRRGDRMRRRPFIRDVGGAAVWPLAASAQRSEKKHIIGMFNAAGAQRTPIWRLHARDSAKEVSTGSSWTPIFVANARARSNGGPRSSPLFGSENDHSGEFF